MKVLLFISIALFAASCGSKKEEKKETYSYQLSQNGCDTGSHTFSSKQEMCNGLLNDSLNGNCAHYLREQRYISDSCESITGEKF